MTDLYSADKKPQFDTIKRSLVKEARNCFDPSISKTTGNISTLRDINQLIFRDIENQLPLSLEIDLNTDDYQAVREIILVQIFGQHMGAYLDYSKIKTNPLYNRFVRSAKDANMRLENGILLVSIPKDSESASVLYSIQGLTSKLQDINFILEIYDPENPYNYNIIEHEKWHIFQKKVYQATDRLNKGIKDPRRKQRGIRYSNRTVCFRI